MSDDKLTPPTQGKASFLSGARQLTAYGVQLALIVALASIPAYIMFLIGDPDYHGSLWGKVVFVICMCLYLVAQLAPRASNAVRDMWTRRALRRQLAAHVALAGLADADPRDPRRVELERTFWRESQAEALRALRQRFAREPKVLDIFSTLRDSVSNSQKPLMWCVALPGVIMAFSAWIAFFLEIVWLIMVAYIVGAVFVVCSIAVAGLILVEGITTQRQSLIAHRTFATERRRIATMAELAGGLSLAEHEIDDALRGAISPDTARGGALSEVTSPHAPRGFDPNQFPSDTPILMRLDGSPDEESEEGDHGR